MAAWFTLQPGPNTITVEFNLGSSGSGAPTIEFIFDEAWY
jgi:hypothetical protein